MMSNDGSLSLTGVAVASDAARLLDEICEHFVEHAEVGRTGAVAVLSSQFGTATIRLEEPKLLIALACPSQTALQMARTSIAEHMFYFAGDEPLELTWSEPASTARLPNLYEVTVVGAENITPHMRRVTFSCDDVAPFVGGDMHVRILVPPKGRQPVWPGYRGDGRLAWPDGEDELLVRVYTIRAVDADRRELSIDFWQHPVAGVSTPGADFARDAQAGDRLALLGPGAGSVPSVRSILLIGDESALPAIARIAAEVPEGTDMRAIIEVLDAAEEQPLPSAGSLDVRWLHRSSYTAGATGVLAQEAKKAITSADAETFIWVACEKADVRSIRAILKERRHDKSHMYVAWYWER
jgi:NADPH-dependent ferric siderophore reductase